MNIFYKFPTVNTSKLNFWLVICIAKNFIWTTLKMIFSIFRFFCTLRFQIFKYCPIITNHNKWKYYLFSFQMTYKSKIPKMDPYDWFCCPGSHSVGFTHKELFNTHINCYIKLYNTIQKFEVRKILFYKNNLRNWLLFIKDALNWPNVTAKSFIMLLNIYIPDECYSFELSIHLWILKKKNVSRFPLKQL